MVKTIWAVACSSAAAGILAAGVAGCGSVPVKGGNPAVAVEGQASTTGVVPAGTSSSETVSYSGSKYRIGPEDVLHVSVWGNQELTLDVTVRPDGKISLPLVQDIQAEGLTAIELSDLLSRRLTAFIRDPQVSVIVTQVNSPKVFVIGNVTRPGPYPLRSDMSILQALSLAGGLTPFASPKSITVLRNDGGERDMRKVNYYDMIDTGEGNYMLKPGDTIVVP